jgi:hypothetical protein
MQVPEGTPVLPAIGPCNQSVAPQTREVYNSKACLKIDGSTQHKSRVNFWETFAPVASSSAIWLILTNIVTNSQAEIASKLRSTRRFQRDSMSKAKTPRICTGKAQMSQELNAVISYVKKGKTKVKSNIVHSHKDKIKHKVTNTNHLFIIWLI